MYKKILLPTDGSTYADDEVERATKLLGDDGEIIILSVAGKLTSSAFQSRSNVRKINKGLVKEAEDAVNKMIKKFPDDVKVTPLVEVGFPAETINKVAEAHNGGGHKMASGVRTQTFEEAHLIMNELDRVCEQYIKENSLEEENDN